MKNPSRRDFTRYQSAPIEPLEGRVLLSAAVLQSALTFEGVQFAAVLPVTHTVTPDVALAAPSTPVLSSASDSGVKGDRITNVTKPIFTGTAVAGATVTLYSGTTSIGSSVATTKGAYSITSTVALANGTHDITAKASKSGATSAASGTLVLTILTTAPVAPSKPAIVSSATLSPTFKGTAPTGDTVTIYADGKSVGTGVATGGKYSVTVSALVKGSHSIYATATNVAGDVSAKSAAATVVLTAPPVTPKIVYSYVTNDLNYTTTPDGKVTVEVFLKETLTGGAKSLIASEGGLIGAGFSVTRTGTLPTSAAGLTGIAGSITTNGSEFPGGFFMAKTGGSTSFQAGQDVVSLSAATGPVPNSSELIELGTITIQAGASGTTHFTLANFTYPKTTGGFTQTLNAPYDLDVTQTTGTHPYTGAASDPETFTVTVD